MDAEREASIRHVLRYPDEAPAEDTELIDMLADSMAILDAARAEVAALQAALREAVRRFKGVRHDKPLPQFVNELDSMLAEHMPVAHIPGRDTPPAPDAEREALEQFASCFSLKNCTDIPDMAYRKEDNVLTFVGRRGHAALAAVEAARRGGIMNEPIDRKFTITATCHEHGHHHSEHDSLLFLAQDNALPETLRFYRAECVRLGADARQLQGVDRLIERVDRWRRDHPERCKIPDVDAGAVGDSIIGPNDER